MDTFGGSGSTLIACEQVERICNTLVLDPKYATVIVKRYIQQVGTDKDIYVLRDDGEKVHISGVEKPSENDDV